MPQWSKFLFPWYLTVSNLLPVGQTVRAFIYSLVKGIPNPKHLGAWGLLPLGSNYGIVFVSVDNFCCYCIPSKSTKAVYFSNILISLLPNVLTCRTSFSYWHRPTSSCDKVPDDTLGTAESHYTHYGLILRTRSAAMMLTTRPRTAES